MHPMVIVENINRTSITVYIIYIKPFSIILTLSHQQCVHVVSTTITFNNIFYMGSTVYYDSKIMFENDRFL